MSSGDPSPQVIKRGDGYVIHNIDLDRYTVTQKIGLGMLVWDQVQALMEANGEYRAPHRQHGVISLVGGVGSTRDIDKVVADVLGIAPSAITIVRPRLIERTDVVEKLLAGEITNKHDLQRELGMKVRATLAEGAESKAKLSNSYYGKGDKFDEALEPLLRYLAAWEKRGFKYPHVPPRKAQKRIAVLDEVIADLSEARADLENRSHVATLTVPAKTQRKETS